jgi:hypothetical protein
MKLCPALRWEADVAHQIGEARIGVKNLEGGLDFKPNQVHAVLVIALLEPCESLIVLA